MRIPPDTASHQLLNRRTLTVQTAPNADRTKPTISLRRHVATPAPATPAAVSTDAGRPASTPAAGSAPITQEGFNKVWGSDNADYDLNGDGVVNVQDLIQFITAGDPETPADEPAAAAPSTAAAPPSTAAQPEPAAEPGAPITLEGFMKAWGSDDAGYDVNGDGTVNVQDLIEFMLDYPGQGEEASAPHTLGRVDADRVDRLDKLAEHLVGRLEAGGFDPSPSRLAAVLEQLPISAGERQHVLSKVLKAYPSGRSLDVTG